MEPKQPNLNLLERFAAPFPVGDHKARKLKGGGYYIYIPWEKYIQRLDEVLGMNWSVSYSDPAIAGDYLLIRARLTLTWEGGVTTREGLGTIRTYPELNEEGKEKIIGDPLNNAARDAFKDACYQLGIGRYLDDQDAACRLLGVHNAEELWNRTKPKQKGEISREEWQRRRGRNSA